MPTGGNLFKSNVEPGPAPAKSAVAAGDANTDEDEDGDNEDDRAEVTADCPARKTLGKEKGVRDVVSPSTRTNAVPP